MGTAQVTAWYFGMWLHLVTLQEHRGLRESCPIAQGMAGWTTCKNHGREETASPGKVERKKIGREGRRRLTSARGKGGGATKEVSNEVVSWRRYLGEEKNGSRCPVLS